ncbi:MAG: serine/threonine-protein kinase [bacterium]
MGGVPLHARGKVLADLHHPNVIQLVDYGRDSRLGVLYFAMEFIQGKALAEVARDTSMALAFVLEVTRQICSGLAEAHAAGVIHRDLKPENVMLTVTAERRLQVKLLDFGIAQSIAAQTRLTAPGGITGTPHYMSPEQAQDLPVSAASDLYSLGVLMYEMLSGGLPFSADTPLALLLKHVQEPPRELDSTVPDVVAALVMDLLQKPPEQRPKSAGDVGRRIDEIRQRLNVAMVEIDVIDGQPQFERWSSELEPIKGLAAASAKPRRATWWPLAAAAGAAMIAAAGWWLFQPQTPPVALDPATLEQAPILAVADPNGPIVHELARKYVAVAQRTAVQTTSDVAPAHPSEHPAPTANRTPDTPKAVKPVKPVSAQNAPTGTARHHTNSAGVVTSSVPPTDDATLAMRKFKAGGTCSGTNHCVFEASEPPGVVACLNKSTCKADCKIGNCKQYCMDEATCEFTCSGGGCERMAVPTAKMVERD